MDPACGGYSHHMSDQVLTTLLDLERAGWDSLCDGTAAGFYGDVMLPDGVMVVANGMVLGRDDVVAALAQSPPWQTYSIDDIRLVTLDDENAALVYIGTARREGAEPFTAAMTSVYHRVDGSWKLACYQQTPLG